MRIRSRSIGWTRRAIAIQLIALTGCSLFVSLDGLNGGDASAPTSDGAIDSNASDVVAKDAHVVDANGGGDSGFVCSGVVSITTFATTPPSTIGVTFGYSAQAHMPAFDIYYDNVQVQ